jgi:outer membrane protein OmpA-like peptidoglycan-associated protein
MGVNAMFGRTTRMRPMARWLLAGLLLAGGNGCTTVLPPERTEALGPPFNDALKEGYVRLADSRWEEGSWEFLRFRDKARQAMLGDAVWPDDPANVPASLRGDLVEQRERLVMFLDAGGRVLAPQDGALAQVSFDCWVSEVKASRRLDGECRDTFLTSLHETEQAVLAAFPEPYVVLFESGSDRLDAVGLNVATRASRAAMLRAPARINVVGYADPSGSATRNEALSLQRAENVAAALERAGVAPERIQVQARGASGAAEDARRVEITLES